MSKTVRRPSGSERGVITPGGLLRTSHVAGAAVATAPMRRAESLSAPDHIDQATFMERLQHSADSDTTNLLDLGATDRLAIGNDRERLERGGGEPLRARRELRALDCFGVLGARENLPAASDFLQLDTVAVDVIVLTQLVDGRGEGSGRVVGRQRRQLLGGYRTRAREERGLKQLR